MCVCKTEQIMLLLLIGHISLIFSALFTAQTQSLNFANNVCKHLHEYPTWYIHPECRYEADYVLQPAALAAANGNPFEQHEVETADGYVLTLFRVASRANRTGRERPVFIQHGAFMNSRSFLNGGNQSLGFYLADHGYDVWLGNNRGTTYSKKHKFLNTTDAQYWDFCLDDLAKYDMEASIDYVANATGKAGSIVYIGYSQGTVTGFMYLINNLQMERLPIEAFIQLAPVAKWKRVSAVIAVLIRLSPIVQKIVELFNVSGLFAHEDRFRPVVLILCRVYANLCSDTLRWLTGAPSPQFGPENLFQIYTNFPSGISVKLLVQFRQWYLTKRFAKFDYGPEMNVKLYGDVLPPLYNLRSIKIPVYLFYGSGDALATAKNTKITYEELGSTDKAIINVGADEGYKLSHLEFVAGTKVVDLIYKPILDIMKERLNDTAT